MAAMFDFLRKEDKFNVGILFLWLGALFNISWKLSYLGGDTLIHLIFAENMARGHPLEFNPGHILAGATSPFWTLIISLFFKFFSPSMVAVLLKACGLTLFGWTTALTAHLFCKTAVGPSALPRRPLEAPLLRF